jgi:hypothetical protein
VTFTASVTLHDKRAVSPARIDAGDAAKLAICGALNVPARIAWFAVSAMISLPFRSTAIANASAKRAASAGPLTLPGASGKPATVVVAPSGLIQRIVALPVSVT